MPELDMILGSIKTPAQQVKTASEKVPTEAELLNALNEAVPAATTKVASQAGSPTGDLLKIASDLRATDDERLIKTSQLAGVAFADAAATRFAQWDAAIGNTAAVKTASEDSFEKFASENPELVQQAAELGYTRTMGALEKQASDEYAQGYNETVDAIHKQASWEFLNGVVCAGQLIEANK